MSKLYKWKKINYKTFLPKHAPVVVYIVAKANTFDRHHHMIQRPAKGAPSSGNVQQQNQLPLAQPPTVPTTQKHFMMHAAAHAREFDRRYTQTDVSRQLREKGTRLLSEDRQANPEV